jgi:hypothetical protein
VDRALDCACACVKRDARTGACKVRGNDELELELDLGFLF